MQTANKPDEGPRLSKVWSGVATGRDTLEDLPLLAQLATQRNSADFADYVRSRLDEKTYGKTWCLSELFKMDDSGHRGAIRDVLCGVSGRNSKVSFAGRTKQLFKLGVVHDAPFEVLIAAPPAHAKPLSRKGRIGIGQPGSAFDDHPIYSIGSRKPRVGHTFGPGEIFEVPIVGMEDGGPIWESALTLLEDHGWNVYKGGRIRQRFTEQNDRTNPRPGHPNKLYRHDHWRVYEVAALEMHPEWFTKRIATTEFEDDQKTNWRLYNEDADTARAAGGGDLLSLVEKVQGLEARVKDSESKASEADALQAELEAVQAENEKLKTKAKPKSG